MSTLQTSKTKKRCSKCNKLKDVSCYQVMWTRNNRLNSQCKKCHRLLTSAWYQRNKVKIAAEVQKHRRTKKGHIKYLYKSIYDRAGKEKYYFHVKLLFTLEEYTKWIKTSNYSAVYNKWKANNFILKYTPVTDRLDPKGHYSLDNIQIISHSENATKSNKKPI